MGIGKCTVNRCDRGHYAKGYCHKHYQSWRKWGDPTVNNTAQKKKCSIPTCDKWHLAKGYCNSHYLRWKKHGDPLAGGPAPAKKGALLAFLKEVAVNPPKNECVQWPFGMSDNGYGSIHDERGSHPHRVVLVLHSGINPQDKQAAHKCGNRCCVNPLHLYWATPKQNMQDKIAHGTHIQGEKQGISKLTESQVKSIFLDARPNPVIAKENNIVHQTVSDIKRGRRWAWLTECLKKTA